jgi:hypothetical protein
LPVVGEFAASSVEGGLAQATCGTERPDGLAGIPPGGQDATPELFAVEVAAAGLRHGWSLLDGERASSVPKPARRPGTGRLHKILLVEGVTEVLTIQQFLRLYQKDHKIVLVPLSGNNLINGSHEQELGELTRISANVFALIDSERSSSDAPLEQRRTDFVQVCKNAGLLNCHVLERRATENYFTDAAVKAVKGNNYRELAPYEKLGIQSPSWTKDENWRIARAMKVEDLEHTDLGKFLCSL